ncbi:MAG: hypothetical protein ACHP6H_01330 [Legionellales bacterium]
MKWNDWFWAANKKVVETSIDTTASTLNTLGSLACMVSGAGFALSSSIDEALSASYFGSSHTVGHTNITVRIGENGYSVNKTIPFAFYKEVDGMDNLSEYIDPIKIKQLSMILSAAGVFARALGASIHKWQKSKEDDRFFQNKYQVALESPKIREYLLVNAESLSGSLAQIMISKAVMGSFIYYSGLVGTTYSLTYPPSSTQRVTTNTYKGPVKRRLVSFEFDSDTNSSLDAQEEDPPIDLDQIMHARALANMTYGGGLFFQSETPPGYPVVVPATLGFGLHIISTFFAKKAKQERDERVFNTQQNSFFPL